MESTGPGWMWSDCRAQTGAIVGGGNKVSPVPAYHMGAQSDQGFGTESGI